MASQIWLGTECRLKDASEGQSELKMTSLIQDKGEKKNMGDTDIKGIMSKYRGVQRGREHSVGCGLHSPDLETQLSAGSTGRRTRVCVMLSPSKSVRSGGSDHRGGREDSADNC